MKVAVGYIIRRRQVLAERTEIVFWTGSRSALDGTAWTTTRGLAVRVGFRYAHDRVKRMRRETAAQQHTLYNVERFVPLYKP